MDIHQDWRFFTGLSIICWGLWGFFSKMTLDRLDWGAIFVLFGLSTLLIATVSSPQSYFVLFQKSAWMGVLAGITGALGFLFFYRALQQGMVSVVIPFSSLYILVAVILAVVFLHEPLTVKKLLGIVSAIIAIILLSQQTGD